MPSNFEAMKLCNFGTSCVIRDCKFYHPDGKETDQSDRMGKMDRRCYYGQKCYKRDCSFKHPSDGQDERLEDLINLGGSDLIEFDEPEVDDAGRDYQSGGVIRVESDKKRIISPRLCDKCGEKRHEGRRCSVKKLRCNYPPCLKPYGHATSVCWDLMKRCRLPICNDQRGHKAESHTRCFRDATGKIGEEQEAADYFKTQFRMYKSHLNGAEIDVIRRYENGE